MISLTNEAIKRCCYDQPKINDTAVNLTKHARIADLVIGIILCLAAILAAHGVIPIGGAFFTGFGVAQVAYIVLTGCYNCCKDPCILMQNKGCCGAFVELFEVASDSFTDMSGGE